MNIKFQITKVKELQKMSKASRNTDLAFRTLCDATQSLCDVVLELLIETSNLKAEIQSIK